MIVLAWSTMINPNIENNSNSKILNLNMKYDLCVSTHQDKSYSIAHIALPKLHIIHSLILPLAAIQGLTNEMITDPAQLIASIPNGILLNARINYNLRLCRGIGGAIIIILI